MYTLPLRRSGVVAMQNMRCAIRARAVRYAARAFFMRRFSDSAAAMPLRAFAMLLRRR